MHVPAAMHQETETHIAQLPLSAASMRLTEVNISEPRKIFPRNKRYRSLIDDVLCGAYLSCLGMNLDCIL